MKIPESNVNAAAAAVAGSQTVDNKAQAARVGAGTGYGPTDQVELSSLATEVSRLQSESSDRSERVKSLAAEYRAGTYRADSQAAARGIVADAFGN